MSTSFIYGWIEKVPVRLLLVLYLVNVGFDYYFFNKDSSSIFVTKKKELRKIKENNNNLKNKIQELDDFFKNLETKKKLLKNKMTEVDGFNGLLTEKFDVPAFVKMTLTEAKKAGLSVQSLKPKEVKEKDHYSENIFQLNIQGVFEQILTFLERMSKVSEVIHIENFSIKSVDPYQARLVQLEGFFELKTYRYRESP